MSTMTHAPQENLETLGRHWVSIHIFTDGSLDDVIVDLARPVSARLRGDGAVLGHFVLRYWDGGPHLRWRLLARDADEVERIKASVITSTQAYLSEHPAGLLYGPQAYAQHAPGFAAAEKVSDYLRERMPPDSYAFIDYVPETHRYGDDAALAAAEDHFIRCTAAVERIIGERPSANERTTAAFAVLTLAWSVTREFVKRSSGEMFDRADAFSRSVDETVTGAYRAQRESLLTIARRLSMLAAAPPEADAGSLAQWARSMTQLADTVSVHRSVGAVGPVLDLCAHLTCNRLGVGVMGEQHVRGLAASAWAELYETEVIA